MRYRSGHSYNGEGRLRKAINTRFYFVCGCDSCCYFFFSSRRRHTRLQGDWSSDVCSSDLDVRKVQPVDGVAFVMAFDDCVRGRFDAVVIVDVLYKIPIAEWDALLARCAARQIGRASCRERV